MVRQERDSNWCLSGEREANCASPPSCLVAASSPTALYSQAGVGGGTGTLDIPWAHRVPGNTAERGSQERAGLVGSEGSNSCLLYCSESGFAARPQSHGADPSGLELLLYVKRGRDVILPWCSSGPSQPVQSPPQGSDREVRLVYLPQAHRTSAQK